MKAVIFDVDGTLADVSHRLHHLNDQTIDRAEQWKRFFAAQCDDTIIEPVAEVAKALHATGNVILVVSARPEDYRDVTQRLLSDNFVPFTHVYMRANGDTRPDNTVKAEILQQILEEGYEPFLVVDDRPEVVDMWRSFGLTTLACEWKEGESKYAGSCLLHMMVGPSGSGKTSFVNTHYPKHEVISTDQIREDHGFSHHPHDLQRTWDLARALVKARLEAGFRTVLDATSIRRKDRLNILSLVPKGQLARYIVIDREFDAKLASRGDRSVDLITKHHKTFVGNLKDILAGDDQPNVIVEDRREHKV